MKFSNYFQKLGFSDREARVFLNLHKLGSSQPASTIARNANMERTTVYKILLKLVDLNLVSMTKQGGIAYFYIPQLGTIRNFIKNRIENFEYLEEMYPEVESELKQFESGYKSNLPRINLYDGFEGVKNVYESIVEDIQTNGYISIKFFASNVFESQITTNLELKDYAREFFVKLKNKKISIDTYLGNGMMIMESISKTVDINLETFASLPVSNSAINIFVVGKSLYMIIFKDIPFGLRIISEDLAYSMHFLFDNVKVE